VGKQTDYKHFFHGEKIVYIKYSTYILILLIFITGCKKNIPADLPPLYPCEITVIQNGLPLDGATVILSYTNESRPTEGQRWFPMGVSDENGIVLIRSNSLYDGAPKGVYKVTVQKTISGKSKYGPPPPENSPKYEKWEEIVNNEEIPVYGLVETQYTDADKTPHQIEIQKGKNKLTVDVGKSVEYRIKE
jgi:hypothetical protein